MQPTVGYFIFAQIIAVALLESGRVYVRAQGGGNGASRVYGSGYEPMKAYEGVSFKNVNTDTLSEARRKALQGNMHSQYFLALTLLYTTLGTDQEIAQSIAEAAAWFEKASDQGHLEAKTNLALLTLAGAGVSVDPLRAWELLREATDLGSTDAPWLLGRMYYDMRVTWEPGSEFERGLEYFMTAADRGSARGMFYVGVMHEYGLGMEARDPFEASKWYKKASDLRDAEAMYYYALQHMYGRGVPKNTPEAVSLFHESANLQHAPAMMFLAKIYSEGANGVAIDYNRAANWYAQAAEAGDEIVAPQAAAARDEMRKYLKEAEDVMKGFLQELGYE